MRWKRWSVAVVMVAWGWTMGLSSASAEEAPLRVAYTYVGGDDHGDDGGLLMAIMDQSSGIDLYDGDEVLESGEALTDSGLEALLVHDVDRFDGHEIDVIGPEDETLAMVRRSASEPWEEEDVQGVLREVFDILVPEIRAFRDQGGVSEESEEELTHLSIREQAIAEHRERLGPFGSYMSFFLGGYVGMRSMELISTGSEAGPVVNVDTDWLGVAARVDGRLSALGSYRSAIEAEGAIRFAPVSVVIDEEDLSGTALGLSAELRYVNLRNSFLRLRLLGGIESFNLSINQNPLYTGHGYMMGRGGAGAEMRFGSAVTVTADALALPIVIASNSGGAYGDPSGWLGAGADASLRIDAMRPWVIRLDYGLRFMTLEQRDAPDFEETLESEDWLHMVGLSVGYRR